MAPITLANAPAKSKAIDLPILVIEFELKLPELHYFVIYRMPVLHCDGDAVAITIIISAITSTSHENFHVTFVIISEICIAI